MRKIPEWVGKSDDAAIPEKVMLRLWDKCKGHCEDCARKIMAGEKKHFDHRIALADGGRHAENNLQVLCVPCHTVKTGEEATERAKVRSKTSAIQGFKKSKHPIPSRGFPKFEKPGRIDKSALPPLPLSRLMQSGIARSRA